MRANFVGAGLRIGIVQARFNEDVCHGLLASCLADETHGRGRPRRAARVGPGALEIRWRCSGMAETQQFRRADRAGRVIRGETYHFELVSNEAGAGSPGSGLELRHPDLQRRVDHRE